MKKSDWVDIAKRRIDNILRKYLYANQRQLEVKISESGPFNQRAEPVLISDAIRELKQEKAIGFESPGGGQPQYYYLSGHFDPSKDLHANRRKDVLQYYSEFLNLSQDFHLCGDALETVIWNAHDQVKSLYTPFGSMKHPVETFGTVTLPGSLDFTWLLNPQSMLVAGEAKNVREWIYPQAQEIWGLLGKATRLMEHGLPVLPILVARKIPYVTYKFFQEIGMLGYQMHHQIFMPAAETKLTNVIRKDGVGFHDISTDLTPPEALIRFFSNTVPAEAPKATERFRSLQNLLKEFAIDQGLERKDLRNRSAVWREFKEALSFEEMVYETE